MQGALKAAYYDAYHAARQEINAGVSGTEGQSGFACCLERIFDDSTKKLINKPVVIPFIPMTLFDLVMEAHPVERLFHAVRIFNNGNLLYAYIELFNAFQHYVLLSEKYNVAKYGNIDKSYGNIIELNEPLDEDLLKSVTPRDYKDADIIRNQYRIDIDKLVKMLKKYHNYDSLERSEQVNMLFARIGKLAYEQIRVQSYIKGYEELMDCHYDSIDFLKEFTEIDDFERKSQFMQAFQFYTIYDDDCINFKMYKKVLPDGYDYPTAIYNILNSGQQVKAYGYMKFHMLESRSN